MRLPRIFLAAGTVSLLAACAGKAPAPSNSQNASDLLATWKNGSMDKASWENWKKNSGMGPQTPAGDLPKMFNDYIRFQLDAKAAADYGLTGDKAKADRWASIVDRILG
ncbi:MAG: hypothetical protein RL173_3150, partial [Fibrobacterota bacterium]